ncbi:MAG: DUF262 domain-containing protein [Magnetococcales bacterium]|nr:DUF262 domain-containing protein [Magnetococcales bacterium]
MLADEIDNAMRLVRTDAYQMSVGEIVSMYENKEIIIDPDFQRLFRWNDGQKSKLIESMLLGIPLPSIFVFERENGQWELIDGLQRISTILEFMGRLRRTDGTLNPASVLEATTYLPSLHNVVWERWDNIDISVNEQNPLEKSQQLAIRRGRLGVEILKRPSDTKTKYDLFQRLNAGGTQANAQELRNCIIIMINRDFFNIIKLAAEDKIFKEIISVSDDQFEKQRHMEWATRFLVHAKIPYNGRLDVEQYIDEGIKQLAKEGDTNNAKIMIDKTFDLLNRAVGTNALRRLQGESHTGRVGLVGLEVIAVGIAKNLARIEDLGPQKAQEFVKQKIIDFWDQREVESFAAPGLRGTLRLQRTVPFGEKWFCP